MKLFRYDRSSNETSIKKTPNSDGPNDMPNDQIDCTNNVVMKKVTEIDDSEVQIPKYKTNHPYEQCSPMITKSNHISDEPREKQLLRNIIYI